MSELQAASSHYDDWLHYRRKARWVSYWHQITEVLAVNPETCPEVGIGAGFVRDALSKQGVKVTTVDIDQELGVDRVGDVRDLPCEDGEFDVVLCSQVLEHIPWPTVPRPLPSSVGSAGRIASCHCRNPAPVSGRRSESVPEAGSRSVESRCDCLTHDATGSTDSITGRCCRAERDSGRFGGCSPTDSR